MAAIENAVPLEELVNGASAHSASQSNGDSHAAELAAADQAAQHVQIPPVLVHLPSPSHSRTLPKRANPKETYTSLTLLPQAHETVQELKLAISEWVGGYWLGPYSLRLPSSRGKAVNGESGGKAVLLHKAKEGIEVREGERLSEWLEVGDVFSHLKDGEERVLEVVREPYSDYSARQTVLRFIELTSPAGTSLHPAWTPNGPLSGCSIFESVRDGTSASASEPIYTEVEVALPSGRKGKAGKKEVIKVKREVASDSTNPFADWKADAAPVDFSQLPLHTPLPTAQPCVKSCQLSPFNPPPPHLRQKGHQLYLQVSLLEGDTVTLVCTSRGWYVSKSNINTFDPTPKSPEPLYHSLVDLMHSISPLFTERLSALAPLSTIPPTSEPIASVPIPQTEPAYSFLAPAPKSNTPAEILRTQLAYLHTGATTADALDSARDWNEEIQGVKELPRGGMHERINREKLAQKTWAEFTQACVRSVMTVSRGDVPPLNPNESPRCHMWLLSNIFITRATDCIDIYAHVGGDAAAWVSHGKDAAGVRLLNKADIDGAHLLGHTVVDWAGERWTCQSMLPGIFSRPKAEAEVEAEADVEAGVDGGKLETEKAKLNGETGPTSAESDTKEDWVNVSPGKSVKSDIAAGSDAEAKPNGHDGAAKTGEQDADEDDEDELPENQLIIYGFDSERTSVVHWDAPTHKVMSKIAQALKLAPHKIRNGQGEEFEFYASAEVKALRGTDGRRYLLDLPRLMPVDVEWLQNDLQGAAAKAIGDLDGPGAGEAKDRQQAETLPAYPHRVVLLRPELTEVFWESELKRWARAVAAQRQEKMLAEEKEKGSDGSSETKVDSESQADGSSDKVNGSASTEEVAGSDTANAVDGHEQPSDAPASAEATTVSAPAPSLGSAEPFKEFQLHFNPDAFVDLPAKKGSTDKTAFVPSRLTDESDPAIQSVRDASRYLRKVAIPGFTLDVMMGNTSGISDGASLSKVMHQRGINIRYLGYLASSVESFGKSPNPDAESESADGTPKGHLGAFKEVVLQEMVYRAAKHLLREAIRGLQPEHVSSAVSHFLNCLLSGPNVPAPKAAYSALGLGDEIEPSFVSLTPEKLRNDITAEVARRFRWQLDESFLRTGLRRRQFLRELASRFAFQLVQRDYQFDSLCSEEEGGAKENGTSAETEEPLANGAGKKDKKKDKAKKEDARSEATAVRHTVFVPEDIITMIPVVRSTAPSATVPEEIMDTGRNIINRGNMDVGLELMIESIQYLEQIHSVIHPEVAKAYDAYASMLLALARLKIQQLSGEGDTAQPLGLDIAQGIKLQRQAVIIAERTLGVYHPETAGYYFNLAMLENLEGDSTLSLRYFRHALLLWDVIYGPGHPEVNTILSNAGVVLQATNEGALSLSLHAAVQRTAATIFGSDHLTNGQALHQLTQAHFIAGDIPAALASARAAFGIFKARLGEEHSQSKEVAKNVELLGNVVENIERQKAATAQAKERQLERLRAAQARVAATTRRRLPTAAGVSAAASVPGAAEANGSGSAEVEAAVQEASRIGERGHLDVDELVRFIQGQGQVGGSGGGVKRGKNALRGKRRTGAKR